jgi:hypothetical protein
LELLDGSGSIAAISPKMTMALAGQIIFKLGCGSITARRPCRALADELLLCKALHRLGNKAVTEGLDVVQAERLLRAELE